MTSEVRVSVIIPTYMRGHLIRYALESLRNQTCNDFEVLIVLKPSGDQTTAIAEEFRNYLDIRLILQNQGSMVDAISLGINHAQGIVIACLDDDAVPNHDWVENHIVAYGRDQDIGGVAGDVFPVILEGNRFMPINGNPSEIIPDSKVLTSRLSLTTWRQPIEGLENSLVYISKAGLVEYNTTIAWLARRHPVESLLGMGANMSFLAEAVRNFKFTDSWILGLSNEQYLAWHLWRQGYRLVFDPSIKVSHIHHGQSLSRNIKQAKKDILRWTEYNLLFYRLYGVEPGISIMHRLVWLIFDSIVNIKKFCVDRDASQLARFKSKFYSESIGLKWLLSQKLGSSYSPLSDLKRIINIR